MRPHRGPRTTGVLVGALLLAAAALGVLAALGVPAGLPYDEPAHWSTVLFVARHGALPVLGEPGVTYEGQQAPAFYIVAAWLVQVFGSGSVGFTAVRLFGVLGAVALAWLVALLLRRTVPGQPAVIVAGTAFVALNPMLIVMSASVQNDTWSLVAGFGALLVALGGPGAHPWRRGAAIGVLSALAILVKISIAPLVLGVLAVLLVRRRWREALTTAIVVAAGCGWWVLRNLRLYGDLTGQAGVDAAGYHFAAGATTPFALVREALTYLALPVEYLRNVFSAPAWIDALTVALGAALVLGALAMATVGRRHLRALPFVFLAVVGIASVGAWLLQVALGWHVAFRTAYGVLPLAALAYGAVALWFRRPRARAVACVALVALLVVLCAWVAVQIAAVADRAMLTF